MESHCTDLELGSYTKSLFQKLTMGFDCNRIKLNHQPAGCTFHGAHVRIRISICATHVVYVVGAGHVTLLGPSLLRLIYSSFRRWSVETLTWPSVSCSNNRLSPANYSKIQIYFVSEQIYVI